MHKITAFPEAHPAALHVPTPVQAAGLGAEPTQAELETFFRAPPPPGRSRESRIVLDAEGRFWQGGEPFEHAKLAEAFHRWIGRHPDDGRYVLSNGLDWSYFTVEDAPFFVRSLREEGGAPWVVLSDGSAEPLDPTRCRIGPTGAVYCQVKHDARGGPYDAKLTRHAQTSLEPYLTELDGRPALRVGGIVHALGE